MSQPTPTNLTAAEPGAPDTTDIFAPLLTLEDQYYTEGYALGVADGSRSGRIEGRLFGLEKGFAKAIAMGRLNGRAAVWSARLPAEGESVPHNSDGEGMTQLLPRLPASHRLRKHVERLKELTDPQSLETKNTEDGVNEFDERLAGASSKLKLIAKIVGEDDGEREALAAKASSGDSKQTTSEMEDFTGLAQARKATT